VVGKAKSYSLTDRRKNRRKSSRMADFIPFSNPQDLADHAAARVADLARLGIAERGAASVILPGGRTPELFLAALARAPLDWPRISLTLCDERWVDETSPDSNAAMVRRTLLTGAAAEASFLPLYNGAASPAAGCRAVEAAIRLLPRPWDATILGIGDDGHFASLFPGEPALVAGLNLAGQQDCVPARGPAGGPPRLSLTLASLARSRHIFIIATGRHKRQIWEQAACSDPAVLPAAALHRLTGIAVDFLWCEAERQ
jgi:6-phosphogluconolactonase